MSRKLGLSVFCLPSCSLEFFMYLASPTIKLPPPQAHAQVDLKYNIAINCLYCSSLALSS